MQPLSPLAFCFLRPFSKKYAALLTTPARTPRADGSSGSPRAYAAPGSLAPAFLLVFLALLIRLDPPGVFNSSYSEHPDILHLYNIDLIALATYVYLGIFNTGVLINPLRLWPKILSHLDVVEVNGKQDSAELYTFVPLLRNRRSRYRPSKIM